ncbi:telomere-associated protein Tap [Streptomyces meridianus]|uniref:Transcriptional regulator n=1 Tax=Streptomyces meridianus TaxID=2938945 RepID=A0ABT0XBQ4_9ACTN|nr:helix-turn-helix transcriptional regulator [Streptomyces meridianus]MCM2579955.1 transcriptional regulator [Streptomyces meridianus]
MPESDKLLAAVDALLARPDDLPPPEERERLRKAARVTQADLAGVFGVRRETIVAWEAGRNEPRPPKREAYVRLLAGWAARYPADGTSAAPQPPAGPVPPAPADRTPSGEPVTASPEPCVLCGRPTPFRGGGRPQHLDGFCRRSDAAASQTPATGTSAPGTPGPEAAGPEEGPRPTAAPLPRVEGASGNRTTPRTAAPAIRPAAPAGRRRPAGGSGRTPGGRRAAAEAVTSTRFPNGPVAVLGARGTAHLPDGRVLECPARTLPALAAWATAEAGLGAERLHRSGRDADPLVVLTAAAARELGLPLELEDRRSLRLPDTHPVVRQLARTDWRLTRRGFGPWARIYRSAADGRRRCVQLAVLPWDALDARSWGGAGGMEPQRLARVLGDYTRRVRTPCGSTAVTGLELMTSLRPPTRAVRDETDGGWTSGPVPGSLTAPVDPAPPEAPDEHPVARGRAVGECLDEEAYEWHRAAELLDDDERDSAYAVGIDVNTAFLAAASRLTVGLGAPVHVREPRFDRKLPGCWRVDLSGIELDPRLPSPFTPHGGRPEGPAWYATPTVAYAVELGAEVEPSEAWVRPDNGPYLDPWHARLREAYLETMEDLGVPAGIDGAGFLEAMDRLCSADPDQRAVLSAVKATVKGGIGKLRERPQGLRHRPGERWPALERPTWRPDIRAAVISTARVNMHRKMARTAAAAGLFPVAVLSDCVVYPSDGPSPLDVLPRSADGKPLPGTFRLGVSPGMVKHEGTQPMSWALGLLAEGHNPARHIKGSDAALEGE